MACSATTWGEMGPVLCDASQRVQTLSEETFFWVLLVLSLLAGFALIRIFFR